MGVFKRIKNMIDGKANAILDDIENPSELYDQTIREKEEALDRAKMASAEFIGSIAQDERELKGLEQLIEKRVALVKKFKSEGKTEEAKKYLAEKLEFDQKLELKKNAVEKKKADIKKLKENLSSLESEIKELKEEKAGLEARLASAKAKKEVNAILAGVNCKGMSLERYRKKVEAEENKADGLEALKPVDTEKELDKYLATNSVDLDSELEKY